MNPFRLFLIDIGAPIRPVVWFPEKWGLGGIDRRGKIRGDTG